MTAGSLAITPYLNRGMKCLSKSSSEPCPDTVFNFGNLAFVPLLKLNDYAALSPLGILPEYKAVEAT